MRHRNPQRGVVISRPIARSDGHGREVFVVKRAVADGFGRDVLKGLDSGLAKQNLKPAIELEFDRNKGAIYALYNRALRDDPALQGKVVLELKIAPDGQVISCRVVSSELKSPELEGKLVARIRMFDFGAKEVEPMVVTWPVDFLPS